MPTDAPVSQEPVEPARWPGRVAVLCEAWKRAPTEREKNRVLSELWLLVNTALTYYIRAHGGSYGYVDPEDARDIASEKAMVFLRDLESQPPAAQADAARICAYLSTLARNGLVDTLRKAGRSRTLERGITTRAWPGVRPASDSAEINLQHTQFVDALRACLLSMSPKARAVWFLRAFLDMPSKKIALHPDVQMTSTGVDMLLSRTRRALSNGMKERGFNAEDTPTGVFVVLWDLLQRDPGGVQRSDLP